MANGQNQYTVADFANIVRQQFPQMQEHGDEDILAFFQEQYPEKLANINFIQPKQPPRKPSLFEPTAAEFSEFTKRTPLNIKGAAQALKQTTRTTDEDVSKVLYAKQVIDDQHKRPEDRAVTHLPPHTGSQQKSGWINKNPRMGHVDRTTANYLRNIPKDELEQKMAPLVLETERLNQIDYDNYVTLREETDKIIANDPKILAVKEWYADNPIGWGDYFNNWQNFSYGLAKFSTSFGTIWGSGLIGGAVGAVGGAAVGALAGPAGAAYGFGLGWKVGATVGGVSAGFTLEAGNNFDTALREAEKLGLAPEDAMTVASESAFVYGAIASSLEAIVPLSVLNKYGLPKFLNSRMGKDLIEEGLQGLPKGALATAVGKEKFKENVAKRLHKFSQARAKLLEDHKIVDFIHNSLGLIMKAGLEVTVPLGKGFWKKFTGKLETGFAEMATEATQYLAEEMVLEGYVHPDQISDKSAWIWEKLNSDEMRESIQVAAYSFFLPGGGGKATDSSVGMDELDTEANLDEEIAINPSTNQETTNTDDYNGHFQPLEEEISDDMDSPVYELPESRKAEIKKALEEGKPIWDESIGDQSDDRQTAEIDYATEQSGARRSSKDRKAQHKKAKEELLKRFPTISTEDQGSIHDDIDASMDQKQEEIQERTRDELERFNEQVETERAEETELSDPIEQENFIKSTKTNIVTRMQMEMLEAEELRRIYKEEADNLFTYGEEAPEVKDENLSRVEKQIRNLSHPDTVPSTSKTAGEQILDLIEENGAKAIIAIEGMEDSAQEGDWEQGRKRTLLQSLGRELEKSDTKGFFNIEKDAQGMYVEESILGTLKAWVMQKGKTSTSSSTVGDYGEGQETRTIEFGTQPNAETLDQLQAGGNNFNVIDMEAFERQLSEHQQSEVRSEDVSSYDYTSLHSASSMGEVSQTLSEAEFNQALANQDIGALNESTEKKKAIDREVKGEDSQWDRIVNRFEKEGEEPIRNTVLKTNATSLNRLIKELGFEKVLEEAGATKIKSGAFSSTAKNKALLGDLLLTKLAEDNFSEHIWEEGNPSDQSNPDDIFAPDQNAEHNVPERSVGEEKFEAGINDSFNWTEPGVEEATEELDVEWGEKPEEQAAAPDVHPAIIEERQKVFDEWYARQKKEPIKSLRDMAKHHEISGFAKMNRAQLLKALKNITPEKLLDEIYDLGDEGDARLAKIIKDWEAKHPDQTELFSAERLAEGEVLQPFLKDREKLTELIEKRLERHFGKDKLGITAHKFIGLINRDGTNYVGKAIGSLVMWSQDKARIDDIPHEYFHVYAELFADTPLMKYAFKKFTDSGLSEAEAVEQFTELVGNYYAGRIQEKGVANNLKVFIRQMWLSVKKLFGKASKQDLVEIVGERFFQGWVPTTNLLSPSYIPHFSTFNNTNDGADDSVDDDGDQIATDAIEALKENADAFLENIFLDVFAVYIPKSEYSNIIQIANDSYDQEEFDLSFRTYMVDTFRDQIAMGRNVRKEHITSENVVLLGIAPGDLENTQKRTRKYDLYSRQLFQRIKSSTPLAAYTVQEVNEDGTLNKPKFQLLNKNGRVVYDVHLFTKEGGGKTVGAPSIAVQAKNNLGDGTANPTSFRENFLERELKNGTISQRFAYMPMKNIFKRVVAAEDSSWDSFWIKDEVGIQLNSNWVNNINNIFADKFTRSKGKGDLVTFFSTKSGDNKIMILSYSQKAWTGSQQKKYKGKQINTTKATRSFFEAELQAQVDLGWMSEQHMKDFLRNADRLAGKKKKGYKNPHAFAQELSRHISWQSAKGNDYLARQAEHGVADTVNRLRLDWSEGTVVVGSGSRRIVWADHNDIQVKVATTDGVLDVHLQKEIDVGEGYSQDGFMYVASSKLNQRGELLGAPPQSRAVSKTVIRNLTDNGNSYIAVKMLEMSADNGTMFFKKGSETPFAKLKGEGKNSTFIMLDETGAEIEGSEFDSFATRNEVKDVSGRYSRDFSHGINGIHELPEEATRVLMQPYKSNVTAPHPILVHDMLMTNDLSELPEGVEYMDALEEHIREAGKRYMDTLLGFRTNPKNLRDYLVTELADGQMPTELDAYIELFDDGWGMAIPQVVNQLSETLSNQFLINGLFKLRSDKMRGTKTFIKPRGHHDVEAGSALISSENKMMIGRVASDYKKSEGLTFNPWDTVQEKVKILNEWLSQREYNFLMSRQPVSGPTVVEPRRVQGFYQGFQGDTIRLSEYDVFVLLDADMDGDTTFLEVPESKRLMDAISKLSKTEYWKNRRKRKPLSIYKREKRVSSLSNAQDVGNYYETNNAAGMAVGMIVNAKVVMASMAAKQLSISSNILPKGDRIIARDPRDVVRMEYIPLDENMTEAEYNIITENGDRIVTKIEGKDGRLEWRAVPFQHLKAVVKTNRELIHETTLENEMEILLSMATDNPKEQLLGEFDMGVQFLTSRVFKTMSGNPIRPKLLSALRKGVFNTFKNAATRRGQRQTKRGMRGLTMEDVFEESDKLRTIYFDIDGNVRPAQDIQQLLKEEIDLNTPEVRVWMGKELGRIQVQFHDLKVNNHVAAQEHVLSLPQLLMDLNPKIENESVATSPLRYERWMYDDAHVSAVESLSEIMQSKISEYIKSDKQSEEIGGGTLFMEEMSIDFEAIMERQEKQIKNIEGMKYEWNTEFQEFIAKWLPKWDALSPRAQAWATLKFLAGTGKINKKGKKTKVAFRHKLLPIQLMSPQIVKQYAKLYHQRLIGPVQDKIHRTTGDAKYNFQFKAFESVAERICG